MLGIYWNMKKSKNEFLNYWKMKKWKNEFLNYWCYHLEGQPSTDTSLPVLMGRCNFYGEVQFDRGGAILLGGAILWRGAILWGCATWQGGAIWWEGAILRGGAIWWGGAIY